ncbi:MAG: hypothetical protein ACW97O_16105, partial [Candidatus Thorarchaeota archaeon]
MCKTKCVFFLIGAAALLLVQPVSAQPTMTYLGKLQPDHYFAQADSVNNSGQVVGSSWKLKDIRAFIIVPEDIDGDGDLDWFEDAGGGINALMRDLGNFGEDWSFALDISNFGVVVGASRVPPPPGGTIGQTTPFIIVPEDIDGDGDLDWFEDAGGGINALMRNPGTLGGNGGYAAGVNNIGQVVGTTGTNTPGNWHHASLWDANTSAPPVELYTSALNHFSAALDINDFGQAVGVYSDTYTSADVRAVLWTVKNTLIDLGTLGGDTSAAFAINNLGQVAGWSEDGDGMWRAFVITPEDSDNDGRPDTWYEAAKPGDPNLLMTEIDSASNDSV